MRFLEQTVFIVWIKSLWVHISDKISKYHSLNKNADMTNNLNHKSYLENCLLTSFPAPGERSPLIRVTLRIDGSDIRSSPVNRWFIKNDPILFRRVVQVLLIYTNPWSWDIRVATFWVISKNHDAAPTKFWTGNQLTLGSASDHPKNYRRHFANPEMFNVRPV